MKLKHNKRAVSFVELMIGMGISGIAVFAAMKLFSLFSGSAQQAGHRESVNAVVRLIVDKQDCCKTIRKYFDAIPAPVPAAPLTYANFSTTAGVIDLYSKGDRLLKDTLKPWSIRGIVGTTATNIRVQMMHTMPNQKFMGKDLSAGWLGREDITGDGALLICPLGVDYRSSETTCSCRHQAFLCQDQEMNCNCQVSGSCDCVVPSGGTCSAVCPRGQICDCSSGPCVCGAG